MAALGPAASGYHYRWHDGTKFPGGFGETQLLLADYWTLRARSSQLFETNLYARGIIRRFVTNVINTGLHLESVPDESLLGFPEDGLSDWGEEVENRFHVWERCATLCDRSERRTFGTLQRSAYAEALIAGDVLVVLGQSQRTGLPMVQLVPGDTVRSPWKSRPRRGNRIEHGVELDRFDRHAAYWVVQRDGSFKRVPAYGEKSGRRIAWLIYGTDVRLDDVRGKPILSLVLQSLREIDRYRDSVQRKAVINSMLAMFIKKGEEKMGTRPLTGGAVKKTSVVQTEADGSERAFNSAEQIPGFVIDELQHGEEPKGFPSTGTDEKFGDFEEAIVQAFAWALETPPEILRLAFSNNYSASQAAINEYKMFLNAARQQWGEEFCAPIFEDWLLSEVLNQKINADGFLESYRDPKKYDVFRSWVASEWAGQIKPAVDFSKLVRGYKESVAEGFITRDRACRELTGMKYSKVVARLRLENEKLREALGALGPANAEPAQERDGDPVDVDPDEEEDEPPVGLAAV